MRRPKYASIVRVHSDIGGWQWIRLWLRRVARAPRCRSSQKMAIRRMLDPLEVAPLQGRSPLSSGVDFDEQLVMQRYERTSPDHSPVAMS